MHVEPKDTPEALFTLSKLKSYNEIADKLKAVGHAMQGESAELIGYMFAKTGRSVRKWIQRYNAQGIQGLYDRTRPGQPKKLSVEQETHFKQRVLAGPQKQDKGLSRFRLDDLVTILEEEYKVSYSRSGVYGLLERLSLSHIKPRPVHPLNDPQAAKEWQENFPPPFAIKSK